MTEKQPEFRGIPIEEELSGLNEIFTRKVQEQFERGLTDEERLVLQARAAADLTRRVRLARRSPLALYDLLFTDEKGRDIIITWFHKEWEQLILSNRMVQIESPRGSCKTSFMLAACLWLIGRNPNIRIKWLGENDKHATKRLSTLHEILDDPKSIFYKVFPHIQKTKRMGKRPNNASMLNVERDLKTPEPTVEAIGVLSAGTGGRADLLLMDDVVGESNAILNPSLKPKVLAKIQSDWLNTLVPDGRVWCIFTPWSDDDANAILKKTAGWAYRRYAHGKPGDPYYSIFPEKYPSQELRTRRLWLGELHYARAFLCMAHTKDTVAVLPKHLRPITPSILTPEKLFSGQVVISVDPSSGKKLEKGTLDPLGISVLLFIDYTKDFRPTEMQPEPPLPHFEIFVLDAFDTHLPKREQFRLIWQLAEQYQASDIVVEGGAMQDHHEWLIEDQARNPALQRIQIHSWSPRNKSKGQRLLDITFLLNPIPLREGEPTIPITYFHPKTILPNPQEGYMDMASGTTAEIRRGLREEILSFPATHDHVLDSLTQSLSFISETLAPKPMSVQKQTGGSLTVNFITL